MLKTRNTGMRTTLSHHFGPIEPINRNRGYSSIATIDLALYRSGIDDQVVACKYSAMKQTVKPYIPAAATPQLGV